LTLEELVAAALEEDRGTGDLTTTACVPAADEGTARIDSRASIVLSGMEPARLTFEACGGRFKALALEGDRLEPGQGVAEITGPVRGLLEAERVALNFLMRLSGIATHTATVVAAAEGRVKVLDTRKTTPLHRALEKAAVRHGGGKNHRMGLYDMVLIKENHIRAAGSVRAAIHRVRDRVSSSVDIEVEVETLKELSQALDAGADLVLLDNMNDALVSQAVEMCRGRARTEASGRMDAARIARVAQLGVDRASVGGLIHQAVWVDLGMELL
jgi:nicotinate-nucleotide pyrophosphorylase (carboxylating)